MPSEVDALRAIGGPSGVGAPEAALGAGVMPPPPPPPAPGALVYEMEACLNLRLPGEMFMREKFVERLSYWGTGGRSDDERVLTRGKYAAGDETDRCF